MEFTSQEQVINYINAEEGIYFGGTDTRSAEARAAEYAVFCAETEDVEEIRAHLEAIVEAGASFDVNEALEIATK
jgi:NADH dehydrogenase FAD-containing subunit